MDVTEARQRFADVISTVGFGHHRVILCRNGKQIAALIPMDDLEYWQSIENERDLAEARRIDANSKFYTSQEAHRMLGIKPRRKRRHTT